MKQLLLIALLSALMAPTCQQDQSREGKENSPNSNSSETSSRGSKVPLDGGIAILTVGGIMFGLRKLRNRNRDRASS